MVVIDRLLEIRAALEKGDISEHDAILALIDALLEKPVQLGFDSEDLATKIERVLPFDKYTDTLLALCYYYVLQNDGADPTTKDISALLDELRIPQPKNVTDILKKISERTKYLDRVKERSGKRTVTKWRITREGMKYVESLVEGHESGS